MSVANRPINRNVPRQQRGNRNGKGRGQGPGPKPNPKPNAERSYLEPPTNKTIRHETRAYTNQKFRGLERAEGAEKRASERRVGEEGDWWQNYLNTVNQGQADTAAAYAQAGATQQAQMGQASQIDNANTAQLQAEAAKSAELRGAAPSAAPAERAAAAQGMRNYLATAQAGTTALSGANQRAYLDEQKRIGVGQSIASRKEEQRRTRKIEQDRTATRKERGEYATTKRGEITDKAVERQIQSKAFGLDKRKQSAAEREGAADRAIAQQNANSSTRSSKASAKNAATTAKGGGLTPSEKRTIKNEREAPKKDRREAWSALKSLVSSYGPPKNPTAWGELYEKVSGSEVSPSAAHWAIQRYREELARAAAQKRREAGRAVKEESPVHR